MLNALLRVSRQFARFPRHLILMSMQKSFEQAVTSRSVVAFRPKELSEECQKLVINHQRTISTPDIFGQPGFYPPAEQLRGLKAASKLVKVNDVYLTNFGRVFDRQGKALNECWHRPVFLRKHWVKYRLQGTQACRGRVSESIPKLGKVLMLQQQNSHFHGHFLIEVLPRIILAEQYGIEGNCPVYLGVVHESHRQALQLMEMDLGRLVSPADHPVIRVGEAIIPVHTHFKGWSAPGLLKETVARIRARAGQLNGAELPTRIHVARENMKVKNLTNEPQLDQLLNRYGFVKVYPESLSFKSQVQLFAQAEVVVGMHGSAMYNTMFCRPDTVVVDFSAACIDNRLHDILQALDVRHATIQASIGSMRQYRRTQDLCVNLKDLESALMAHRVH